MNTPSTRSGRAAKAAAATQNPAHNPAENRPSPRQIAGRTEQPGASNGSSSARLKSGVKRGETTRHPAAIQAPAPSRAKLKGAAKTQARAQARAEAKAKPNGRVKALTDLAEKMAAKMMTEVLAQQMAQAEARAKAKAAARAQAPQQPHYDNGQRYDTPGLHYAVGDPVPPPPAGAKVRLDLASRSDSDLAGFGQAHKGAMAGNANFPTPTPPATVFDGWLTDFEAKLVELDNMRLILKNLTEQKDAIRAGLQAVFQQRALYVEMASNGDPDIIATSGLPLRRPPTPVGELPWPQNLRIERSVNPGVLIVRWLSVASSKGYVLQCAEVIADQPRDWKQVYIGGKFSHQLMNMEAGKTYEFRVAAIGGSTGQSFWSPVVSLMAA